MPSTGTAHARLPPRLCIALRRSVLRDARPRQRRREPRSGLGVFNAEAERKPHEQYYLCRWFGRDRHRRPVVFRPWLSDQNDPAETGLSHRKAILCWVGEAAWSACEERQCASQPIPGHGTGLMRGLTDHATQVGNASLTRTREFPQASDSPGFRPEQYTLDCFETSRHLE